MFETSKPTTARQHLDRRVATMKLERSSWDPHWKDLNTNFSPRRGKFTTTDRNKGNKRNNLSNNTPLFARRVLTSGLMTGITSPARPWMRLMPPDPGLAAFGPVRAWLDEVEKLMYRVFAASNLYKVLPTIYEECGVFGTAAMIQEDDFEEIARFTPFTVGEYALDLNGDLRVDTFMREYQYTVLQMMQKFGYDACSKYVQNLYDTGNYTTWVDVAHVIEPAELGDYEEFKLDPEFTWRSVYYEPGRDALENKFLAVKGYREFPIMAPRWDAKAGDTYGFSPGMDALGDARALQVQEREKGKAIAKMVSPPTTAPTSLKNTAVSLLPGATNFTDDPNGTFKPIYQVNPQVQHLMLDIQSTEDRINRAFFTDLFLMISRQDDVRTATEIAARQEEKLLQLGPVLEGLHDELLDPLVDRTFAQLMRLAEPGWRGNGPELLPPPPPELDDTELKVEYISILAQAQKLVSTGAMERWVGFTGQLAGIKPEALDKLDTDKIVDHMAEDLGVPSDVILGDEQVQAIREARAQQAQQAQQLAMTQVALDAGTKLADMPTTGGNVLNDIAGVRPPQ